MSAAEKLLHLALVLLPLVLLLPGVSLPVMTVVGTLDRAGMVEIGQQAVIDARVAKVLAKRPDSDVDKLRKRKGRTVRFLSGVLDLDEVSGRVEVYRKSSSVLDTVRTLWGKGYPLVAALVALFSLVVPVLKNSLLLLALFAQGRALGQGAGRVAALLAKWSMADVFLVALFVGFLAFNATSALGGVLELDASVEPGLYWFAGYCVLSIAAGQLMLARLARQRAPKRRPRRR